MSDSESAARVKNSQSKSFRKLNPYIFGGGPLENAGGEDDTEHDHIEALTRKPDAIQCAKCGEWVTDPSKHRHPFPKTKKRIRQSAKPLLNRLESEWLEHIRHLGVHPQAVKLRIARSAFYKPDFFSVRLSTAWEVKGLKGKNIDRGKLALKVAAACWPEIKFLLVWKDAQGQWQEQHVLP